MARPNDAATRFAYVKGYGGAFRGWYEEDGQRKTGPFMATEEEAHRWALRKREEVQRRARAQLDELVREVAPDAQSNQPRRIYDPLRSVSASGLTSIPLRNLGSEERSGAATRIAGRSEPSPALPAATTRPSTPTSTDPFVVCEDGPLGPISLTPRASQAASQAHDEPEPEPALPALIGEFRTLDSVIHDFVGSLDPNARLTANEDSGPTGTEQFRRLLEFSPSQSQVLGPPVLFGTSPRIGLGSLLGFLGYMAKTGVLRVQAGDQTFLVSIVQGDIVHGVSTPRPASELLGQILVARGFVEPEELERFFAQYGASTSKIGEALNRQALVTTEQLRTALELQMLQLFDRMLGTQTSEWCFHEGEVTLAYINMRMNVIRVLLESARKQDEELGGAP